MTLGFRWPLSFFHNGFAADLDAVVVFYNEHKVGDPAPALTAAPRSSRAGGEQLAKPLPSGSSSRISSHTARIELCSACGTVNGGWSFAA